MRLGKNSTHSGQNSHLSRAALAVCCGLVFCSDVCVSSPIWWFYYTHATQNLGLDPVLARAMNSALWVIFTVMQIVWAALQNRGVKAVTILQCQMPLVLHGCRHSAWSALTSVVASTP